MKFQAPGILTSISYNRDGGMRLGFVTNELSDEDKLILTKFHQKFGWVLFQENPYQPSDIPKELAEEGTKTPSKRLRAVLFRLWKQEGEVGDFDAWYRTRMETLISSVKSKLDADVDL
jgi:hypothetical protein